MGSPIILTFDIEDWFQVENLKGQISKDEWEDKKLRVKDNTEKILNLLDRYNQQATFFVLGWIAERVPELVKEIHKKGHEVASHGYGHELIYNLTAEQFREDIRKSKLILENIIGEEIYGYRAPSFSITEWALDILNEEGFLYDSSYFPSDFHDRYSKINLDSESNSFVKIYKENFYEIPISTFNSFGKNFPVGGGGYFRLLPYFIYRKIFQKSVKQNKGGNFYLHPWEIDYKQPKVDNLKLLYKFRHYYGQKNCISKLNNIFKDFKFNKIISIIE